MSSKPAEQFSWFGNILKLSIRACEISNEAGRIDFSKPQRLWPAKADEEVRHCTAACGLISSLVPLRGRHPDMAWQHFNYEDRFFIRPYVGSPMALNAQGNTAAF
jgi:hypothetical protein